MAASREPQTPERLKLHQRLTELGFDRDERLMLAEYLLRRDITSYSQLDQAQVCRLLDATEGFELIVELLAQRPPAG